eukprot:TRINITY_DN7568_c0_g2_i1.p1 TRINITY_DN7568_c0_g2~~TRINITY_DN7568_c0_g2_i1.p1  ORF type:complete len:144 (-),score=16.32 TRINITY_DN7568_c0_g2_i1:18-449(-)
MHPTSLTFLAKRPPNTKMANGRPPHFSRIILPVSSNSEGQAVKEFPPGKIFFINNSHPSLSFRRHILWGWHNGSACKATSFMRVVSITLLWFIASGSMSFSVSHASIDHISSMTTKYLLSQVITKHLPQVLIQFLHLLYILLL